MSLTYIFLKLYIVTIFPSIPQSTIGSFHSFFPPISSNLLSFIHIPFNNVIKVSSILQLFCIDNIDQVFLDQNFSKILGLVT